MISGHHPPSPTSILFDKFSRKRTFIEGQLYAKHQDRPFTCDTVFIMKKLKAPLLDSSLKFRGSDVQSGNKQAKGKE